LEEKSISAMWVSNLSRLQISPELKEIKFKVFPSEEYSSKIEANIGR